MSRKMPLKGLKRSRDHGVDVNQIARNAVVRERLRGAIPLLKRKKLQDIILQLIEHDELLGRVEELVPAEDPVLIAHCLVCHENFDKNNNTNSSECKSMRHEFTVVTRDANNKCPHCHSWGPSCSCSTCNFCGVASCGTYGCESIFCREGRHVSDMRGTKFSDGVKRAIDRVSQGCRICNASSVPSSS